MRQEFIESRQLTVTGNSVATTYPIEALREHGIVDEDDEPREDVDVGFAIEEREDGKYLQAEVPLDA